MDEETRECRLDPKEVQQHFSNFFKTANTNLNQEFLGKTYDEEGHSSLNGIYYPFEEDEVKEASKKIQKDSAMGLDNPPSNCLKDATRCQTTIITALFNLWNMARKIPEELKQSTWLHLSKSGADPEAISGWRPLAIGSTLIRLYASIWASRLTENVKLAPMQRGFLRDQGTHTNFIIWKGVVNRA